MHGRAAEGHDHTAGPEPHTSGTVGCTSVRVTVRPYVPRLAWSSDFFLNFLKQILLFLWGVSLVGLLERQLEFSLPPQIPLGGD